MWNRILVPAHRWLLRVSRGRLGSKMGPQSILLLHHTGRKSGSEYVVPIGYYTYEGSYLIVGTSWGSSKQPDWYLNLRQVSSTTLEIKGKTIPVSVHDAQGEEYERLWQFVTSQNRYYRDIRARLERRIPILVFTPET